MIIDAAPRHGSVWVGQRHGGCIMQSPLPRFSREQRREHPRTKDVTSTVKSLVEALAGNAGRAQESAWTAGRRHTGSSNRRRTPSRHRPVGASYTSCRPTTHSSFQKTPPTSTWAVCGARSGSSGGRKRSRRGAPSSVWAAGAGEQSRRRPGRGARGARQVGLGRGGRSRPGSPGYEAEVGCRRRAADAEGAARQRPGPCSRGHLGACCRQDAAVLSGPIGGVQVIASRLGAVFGALLVLDCARCTVRCARTWRPERRSVPQLGVNLLRSTWLRGRTGLPGSGKRRARAPRDLRPAHPPSSRSRPRVRRPMAAIVGLLLA